MLCVVFCLSPAEFLQTAEGEDFLPTSVYGCVRTTDCSFCPDRMCSVCETFETTLAAAEQMEGFAPAFTEAFISNAA
jgi:hypothetical protein